MDELTSSLSDMLEEFESSLSDTIKDVTEDGLEDILEDILYCAVSDILPEVISECLSEIKFANGTIAKVKQRMKLMNKEKSKVILCYGGLRVDGTRLLVQTRNCSWETIETYTTREDAIDALGAVCTAMEEGFSLFEL